MTSTEGESDTDGDMDLVDILHRLATGILANIDLNPNDDGLEFSHSHDKFNSLTFSIDGYDNI